MTDDEIPTGPLTAIERRNVRKLLLEKERKAWLRKQCMIWLRWVTAAPTLGAGIFFLWQWISPFIARMPHK